MPGTVRHGSFSVLGVAPSRRLLVLLGTLKPPVLLANSSTPKIRVRVFLRSTIHPQRKDGSESADGKGEWTVRKPAPFNTARVRHPTINRAPKRSRSSLAGADRTPALLDQSHRRLGASGETSRCLAIISA